jgi:hypothetical protein
MGRLVDSRRLAITGIGPANTALTLVSDFTHTNSSSSGTLLYSPAKHKYTEKL